VQGRHRDALLRAVRAFGYLPAELPLSDAEVDRLHSVAGAHSGAARELLEEEALRAGAVTLRRNDASLTQVLPAAKASAGEAYEQLRELHPRAVARWGPARFERFTIAACVFAAAGSLSKVVSAGRFRRGVVRLLGDLEEYDSRGPAIVADLQEAMPKAGSKVTEEEQVRELGRWIATRVLDAPPTSRAQLRLAELASDAVHRNFWHRFEELDEPGLRSLVEWFVNPRYRRTAQTPRLRARQEPNA